MPISRRRIVLAASATVLSSMPTLTRSQEAENTYDLIVIGGGVAGLSALVLALERGLSRVLLLESEPMVGGTSIISGGLWAVSGTQLQAQNHIVDTDEAFTQDIFAVGQHKNRPDVVAAFIQHNRPQYEWVINNLGVRPYAITKGAGLPRAHAFRMHELIGALLQKAQKLGGEIRVATKAERLLFDQKQNRVIGCLASRAGGAVEFRSRLGVILATGGFGRNPELLSKFAPRMKYVTSIAAQGARGDGLLMALELGAGLRDMAYLEGSYAFIKEPSTIEDMSLLPYYGAVVVNQQAKRFVDESLPYKQVARVVLEQPGGKSYVVFDERIRRLALEQTLDHHLWASIDHGIVPDYVFAGNSLAQAAQAAGLDPVELQRTIRAYNASLTGEHLPRGPLSVNNGALLAISEAPFYVMPASVCMLGTYCGLSVDAHTRVQRTDDTAINGLFAIGEVIGGFHGASFIMGTALAKAQALARACILYLTAQRASDEKIS